MTDREPDWYRVHEATRVALAEAAFPVLQGKAKTPDLQSLRDLLAVTGAAHDLVNSWVQGALQAIEVCGELVAVALQADTT